MGDCKRTDISGKLAIALSPEEFPSEVKEVEDHLHECGKCREELQALRLLDAFLRENRALLAVPVSECPSPEVVVDFAGGRIADPAVAEHVGSCPECAEQVRLVQDLQSENLTRGGSKPSRADKRLIQEMVAREYGEQSFWAQPFTTFWDRMRSMFSIPSLMMGAVVAAVLMVCLLPYSSKTDSLVPALSTVRWDASSLSITKGVAPAAEASTAKKVAVVLLLRSRGQLSQEEVDDIYGHIDLARKLEGSYDFVSPADVQRTIGKPGEVTDLAALAQAVLDKVKADYVLLFEIGKSDSRYSVRGTVFQNQQSSVKPAISHTGLLPARLPSRITAIGSELLMEAEYSRILSTGNPLS